LINGETWDPVRVVISLREEKKLTGVVKMMEDTLSDFF
jgi:hypothetical protein